jgi:hypothetical protein
MRGGLLKSCTAVSTETHFWGVIETAVRANNYHESGKLTLIIVKFLQVGCNHNEYITRFVKTIPVPV